ncbi:MAG: hypothetical protein EBV07_01015 [Proteobacteria bacterium]|nr:hypothetical protein [Pseudomonadota bacterium]
MGVKDVNEYSVFPNGQIIRNDRLVELIEVIYELLSSFDGQTVLYLLLFKIKFGSLSPKYPRGRKLKDYRDFMINELGFMTKKGSIPRDVRNTLIYLDEVNSLLDKIHPRLLEGKKFPYKLTLSLDQYDPKSKKVFPSKNAWKAYTDQDYRQRWGESMWKSLGELGDGE